MTGDTQAAQLNVDGLSKRIGWKQVVSDVTFSLQPGTLTLLLGRNGAGKTTLVKMLATLLSPSNGTIHWQGRPITELGKAYRRQLGVVLDEPLLYPDLTALENLRFYAQLYGAFEDETSLVEVLDSVALTLQANERVKTFSRGMVQRLAIARSIIHAPNIVLWDEPLTAIDERNVAGVIGLLAERVQQGATALVVVHDFERLWHVADRVLFLGAGRLEHDVPVGDTDVGQVTEWLR